MRGQRCKPGSGGRTGPRLGNVWPSGRLAAEAAEARRLASPGVLEGSTALLCRSCGGEGISPHQVVKPCLLAWQACLTPHLPSLDPHSQRKKPWAGTTKPLRHMGWRGERQAPRENQGMLRCLAGITHPGCHAGVGPHHPVMPKEGQSEDSWGRCLMWWVRSPGEDGG